MVLPTNSAPTKVATAYDGIGDNVVDLDRLHYVFPITNDLQATVMASLGDTTLCRHLNNGLITSNRAPRPS